MYKYYVTASPQGLEGQISEVTTVYPTLQKALDFLKTKTPEQRARLSVPRVGADGWDAGVVQDEDIEKEVSLRNNLYNKR